MIYPPEEDSGGTHTMQFEQTEEPVNPFSPEFLKKVIFTLSQ
jgi:hypothetical protein